MLRQKAYETWSKSPYERMHEETERLKETLDLPKESSSDIIKAEKPKFKSGYILPYVEQSDLRQESDVNLSPLADYIINGEKGGSGGLASAYNNADEATKTRIESVANKLREENVDYDMKAGKKAYLLLDRNGADGMGHSAVFVVNEAGQGIYFSYGSENRERFEGDGEMAMDILTKEETDAFLKTKKLDNTYTTYGNTENKQYTHYFEYDIDGKASEAMIKRAVDYLVYPGDYHLINNQCDKIVKEILDAGDIGYISYKFPILSYSVEAGTNLKELLKQMGLYK